MKPIGREKALPEVQTRTVLNIQELNFSFLEGILDSIGHIKEDHLNDIMMKPIGT